MKAFALWILIRLTITFTPNTYNHFILAMMFIFFYQAVKNKLEVKYFNMVLNGICVIALLQVAMMIAQYFNWWLVIYPKGMVVKSAYLNNFVMHLENNYNQYKHFITGFFGNTNDTSAFLALVFPAFFRKKWLWGIPVIAIALLLAKSLGGIIAGFLVALYFILSTAKKYRFKLTALWVVFGAWAYNFIGNIQELISFSGRLPIWKEVWQNMIIRKPVIGWGLGQFQVDFPAIQKAISSPLLYEGAREGVRWRWTTAHNDYIQLWAELGTIGIVIVLGYIVCTISKGINIKLHADKILFAGLIAGLSNAFVNFMFHTTTAVLFLVYLAMLEKGKEKLQTI